MMTWIILRTQFSKNLLVTDILVCNRLQAHFLRSPQQLRKCWIALKVET